MEQISEPTSMFETILLLAFCLLIGLASLAVVLWLLVTGRLLTLDGLAFALISLTIGGFFMFNVAWSLRTGELRALLGQLGKKKTESEVKSD
jgi:hypothetical protein